MSPNSEIFLFPPRTHWVEFKRCYWYNYYYYNCFLWSIFSLSKTIMNTRIDKTQEASFSKKQLKFSHREDNQLSGKVWINVQSTRITRTCFTDTACASFTLLSLARDLLHSCRWRTRAEANRLIALALFTSHVIWRTLSAPRCLALWGRWNISASTSVPVASLYLTRASTSQRLRKKTQVKHSRLKGGQGMHKRSWNCLAIHKLWENCEKKAVQLD